MNINDYKDSIIVGVLFLLFTRDWFEEGNVPKINSSNQSLVKSRNNTPTMIESL